MFKILVGNQVIFDDIAPIEGLKVIEPKLTLEENAAGSLTFKLPPDNVGYNSIYCLKSEIIVTQDEIEIWRGRVISEEVDFWKCKKYMCEGELAYLNDTIQPPKRYLTSGAPSSPDSNTVYDTTVKKFITTLLNNHNAQVGNNSNKRFSIDPNGITVEDGDTLDDSDAINRFTNYESTLKCINEKLVQKLGGHLRIRHAGNTRYLDYLKDYSQIGASDQVIRFGSNLLDYVQNLESVDWVTAICPKGKRLEIDESAQPVKGLEAYTNVSSAPADGTWHAANSMFVVNQAMVNQYGFICTTVEWDEVTDPTILKNKAKKYLQTVLWDQLCLEISAIDLHYLNPQIETLKLQETVRCISDPHGMDTSFPVTKIEIDMVNPTNTKYTLGTKVSASLTAAQNRANSEIKQQVDDTFIPTESKVLNAAKANATGLINGAANGGFASFIYGTDSDGNALIDQKASGRDEHGVWPKKPTGLRVANAEQDTSATSKWMWTDGGLGHYKRNNTNVLWKNVIVNTAITMDGSIVADRITTGCIKLTGAANIASWNTTGRIESDTASPKRTPPSAFIKVYHENTEIGRWGSDGIFLNEGEIRLGSQKDNRYPCRIYNNRQNNNTFSTGFEFTAYDANNKAVVKFDSTNGLWMHKGSVELGVLASRTYYNSSGNKVTANKYPFQVDNDGSLFTCNGTFAGTISGSHIFGSEILSTDGDDPNKGSVYINNGLLEVDCGHSDQGEYFLKVYSGPEEEDDHDHKNRYHVDIGGHHLTITWMGTDDLWHYEQFSWRLLAEMLLNYKNSD